MFTSSLVRPELAANPVSVQDIEDAYSLFFDQESPVERTEIVRDEHVALAGPYVYRVSELHQPIGAYKIRGAYNKMHNLRQRGITSVVAASAGNHAQGVALSAEVLHMNATIFMPEDPSLDFKAKRVEHFGGDNVDVKRAGETFDEAARAAKEYEASSMGAACQVRPFDDPEVMAGQGTLGLEVANFFEGNQQLDAAFLPVGGGGLLGGVGTALRNRFPGIDLFAVEPEGADSMRRSVQANERLTLEQLDTFVDGAAVGRVGKFTLRAAQALQPTFLQVSRQEVREATTDLHERGVGVELAGALGYAGLRQVAEQLHDKTVAYFATGGNLSKERYKAEIKTK